MRIVSFIGLLFSGRSDELIWRSYDDVGGFLSGK